MAPEQVEKPEDVHNEAVAAELMDIFTETQHGLLWSRYIQKLTKCLIKTTVRSAGNHL